MLAQNFKTAAELHITDVELESLITVLGMLERGELPHADPHGDFSAGGFNLSYAELNVGCKTVACIAGWARHISGGRAFPWAHSANAFTRKSDNPALHELFLPAELYWKGALYNVTPQQAAVALRSFLTTGEARWSEAMDGAAFRHDQP